MVPRLGFELEVKGVALDSDLVLAQPWHKLVTREAPPDHRRVVAQRGDVETIRAVWNCDG
jgi:hypothetical protein